jgi:hypothetical protein
MTDLVPRSGTLDKPAPRLALDGHGVVSINGNASADLPARAGPPRPRSEALPAPVPSKARGELNAHIQLSARLAADVEKADRPVAKLNAQLSQAMAELAAGERVLAEIDTRRAAAIAAAARQGGEVVLPPAGADSEAATAAIEHSRRTVNALRLAIQECSADQARAVAASAEAKARGEGLLLNVLIEFHSKQVLDWARARDVANTLEAELCGLLEAVGQHGRDLEAKTPGAGLVWLRQLEKMRPPFQNLDVGLVELGPKEVFAASRRFLGMLERLRSDADAR